MSHLVNRRGIGASISAMSIIAGKRGSDLRRNPQLLKRGSSLQQWRRATQDHSPLHPEGRSTLSERWGLNENEVDGRAQID